MNYVSVLIRNNDQLKIVRQFPVETIYTDNYSLALENPDIFYQTSRTECSSIDVDNLLVGDVGTLWRYQNKKEIVTDYFLNVANHSSIKVLQKSNVKKVTLSLETPLECIEDIVNKVEIPVEIIIYGSIEVMLLKTHPVIKENGYKLKDKQGNFYSIIVDTDKHIHIFSCEPINKIKEIDRYKKINVSHFRLDFLDEKDLQIKKILEEVFSCLNN